MVRVIFTATCVLISSILFSQPEKEKIKVAILPFYSSDAKPVNDIFFKVFETEYTTVADSVELTQNIFGNVPFNEWIFDLETKSMDKAFAQSKSNIYQGISADRIKLWKLLLMNADYLVISSPIGFESSKAKKGKRLMTIFGMYSIFNLHEGTLLNQCEEQVQFETQSNEEDITPLVEQYFQCFMNSIQQ